MRGSRNRHATANWRNRVYFAQCDYNSVSVCARFINDKVAPTYTPTGFDKFPCTVQLNPHLRVLYTGRSIPQWMDKGKNTSFSVWDTSGSTNFDSVRPLSYSEVVWEASCSVHTDLVHFHRLLPWMPTDNISISRRIFSLFASALLSPSPSTMSEVTGQLRWKTMLENRIVKK